MKKLVVLSGAGMSQESGIPTFRGAGGLWNNYNVTELASPVAWANNPDLVLEFYNFRRKGVIEAKPNKAHVLLAELEKDYNVQIVTQNVDDLHERAGSKNVLHLHGEIRKARSTADESIVVDIDGGELNMGDLCPKGAQLRPHIVWFGEAVPKISEAAHIVSTADIFVVIGTGLQVYPAAGLVDYVKPNAKKFLIDPSEYFAVKDFVHIKDTAVNGMREFLEGIQ